MLQQLSGFDWDSGNRSKCAKHGVSVEEIEAVFQGPVKISPDAAHSRHEPRYQAVGKTPPGRYVFIVFTLRNEKIRPISARYMHGKEIQIYEKDTKEAVSDVQY